MIKIDVEGLEEKLVYDLLHSNSMVQDSRLKF